MGAEPAPVAAGGPPGHVMAAEMGEQPAVVAALLAQGAELRRRLAGVLADPPASIVLVARGSSDNAATFGRYVLEAATGRPVAMAAPSLHTAHRIRSDHRGTLVIGLSQSGETPEVAETVARLGAAGAATVAITNHPASSLGQAAQLVVDLGAGVERAVPATKTFTAQLAALVTIAEATGTPPWTPAARRLVSPRIAEVLADPEPAHRVAADVSASTGDGPVLVVGRGYLYGIALEGALKVRETTGLLAEGCSSADLRHGPIAAVGPATAVVSLRVPGPLHADLADLETRLAARGATVVRCGTATGAELPVPATPPEPLAAFPVVVRLQQLALALAVRRGLDPDAPAGLTKITRT